MGMEAFLALLNDAWFFLSHIAGRSSFPKPLKPAEEKTLIEAMLAGDEAAATAVNMVKLQIEMEAASPDHVPDRRNIN